jgi:hypothetical protein
LQNKHHYSLRTEHNYKSSYSVIDGFGDKGKPAHHDEGSVPPNATLQIILEFVSWKEGPFRKMVLKEGEGDDCPNEGALVKCKSLIHANIL